MGLKIFSEQFREEVLSLNLRTPPDIVLGLTNLSGYAQYEAYRDSLGRDASIRTDRASVTITDPGTVDSLALLPRQTNLNVNLLTPSDILDGIENTTPSQTVAQQYISGRNQPTVINNYSVVNPGDVESIGDIVRPNILNRNLQTPPDISSQIPLGYLDGITNEVVIRDLPVIDPGTVDGAANIERLRLFARNRPLNVNDPSENDPLYSFLSGGSYTYTSLLDTIGRLTVINDLTIPNAISVSTVSNQPPEVTLELQLQQNRYVPVELNEFEPTVLSLRPTDGTQPYINAYNSGIFNYIGAQEYETSSFLNIRTTTSPLSILTNSPDPMASLLNGGNAPLTNETLLMNIAALELKFNFESRIKRAIERETLGRTNIDEALTNPIAAANILRNPYRWGNLFERNYDISIPSNPIGRAAQFAADLAGATNPIALDFALSTSDDLTPRCFLNDEKEESQRGFSRFVRDLVGKNTSRGEDRNVYFLNRTGAGQKYSLFYSVSKNKYQPDYIADYESGVFREGEEVVDFFRGLTGFLGFGSGRRPSGKYYIGSKSEGSDPFYLLQDVEGHQVRSNENLINVIKKSDTTVDYLEPGYSGKGDKGVSEYGSFLTNFIWKSSFSRDTAYDFENNLKSQPINRFPLRDSEETPRQDVSFNRYVAGNFRDCSILFTTSQLLEKGIQTDLGKFNSPIDQIVTKFYDGYDFVSRGNATIAPKKVERYNKFGDIIGYRYLVPGLDASGKRDDKELYNEAEMCRVWTKNRPYSRITDLVRYKELIRKERNSVIDRYGNYNIFPSELNVNNGYGRSGDGLGDAVVEFFGEKRARKYMFSIENLAWRDSELFKTLPNCEKGPNGGRVMWFPPYELSFNETSTANWTSHQFLGRPEPIYTYNTTERTGNVSFSIVVDHPSILNLLAQKEFSRLTDGEVDELLSAFWAGCLEFDVFELARIWNQFSESDINYFKAVLADLDLTRNNNTLKPKIEQVRVFQQPDNISSADVSKEIPVSEINGHNLFFENDVPLRPEIFDEKKDKIYDTGKIEPFDVYFKKYYELVKGINSNQNAERIKDLYGRTHINPEIVNYDYTIGNKSDQNYMEASQMQPRWYGMDSQYKLIESDLSNPKYIGYNLDIFFTAFASPVGPDKNYEYNKNLAKRRYISVVKWLITKVLNKGDLGKLYFDDDTEIKESNIDGRLQTLYNSTEAQPVFNVKRARPDGLKDRITFKLTVYDMVSEADTIFAITPNPDLAGPNKIPYVVVEAKSRNDNTKVKYCCFGKGEDSDKAKAENWVPDFPDNRIGAFETTKPSTYADVVCGVLSIYSAYDRVVTMGVDVSKAPEQKKPTEPVEQPPITETETTSELTSSNITKREIAQRIINKFITECDYFDLLREESPFVYSALKEKLKYFSPAFHSMTPEGLNSRLTFLQQCVRPGDTIRKENESSSCDASNTSFGKPPICVLRIGDFYHTKIVIDNIILNYEPLVLDLNPEGIGIQPMIAKVQVTFRYIGGSGLRKYVDELQNALSFNYYANADIYDDRTFANTDLKERNLINLERSFFDDNVLDLIPIVAAAEKIVPQDFLEDIPYGTIGKVTKKRRPTVAGGPYGDDIFHARTYDRSLIYQPYEIVYYESKFYLRKADDENNLYIRNTLGDSVAFPTNKTYWEEVKWRNYGEQAFSLEFNSITNDSENEDQFLDRTYYNWYEIQYMDLFKDIYSTYGEIVENNFLYNAVISDEKSIFLDLLLNKNHNKILTKSSTSVGNGENFAGDVFDNTNNWRYRNEFETLENYISDSISTMKDFFKEQAADRNYLDIGKLRELTKNVSVTNKSTIFPIKLHMYPQNYMYKIGDGKTIARANFGYNERFNPGYFTSGTMVNEPEIGGFYLKNYANHNENIRVILKNITSEMAAKLKLDIAHFWHLDDSSRNVFNSYLEYFESTHKKIFADYLISKLITYSEEIVNKKTDISNKIELATAKLGCLATGLSVVLNGYDLKSDKTKKFMYEVIPNEYTLTSTPESLFGYDPYYQYKTISFDNKIITFTEVIDYISKRKDSYADAYKFMSLANGLYFFKQIAKNEDINILMNSFIYVYDNGRFIEVPSSIYTFDNNLPLSIAITDDVSLDIDAPNFKIVEGMELNSQKNKFALDGKTTTLDAQPDPGEDVKGSFAERYKMKYTFEKLNYEFFDFANKSLDVMLNDNFMDKKFDFDTVYESIKDFNNQIKDIGATNLFYYGDRVSEIDTKLGYYRIDLFPLEETSTINYFEVIDNFIKYDYFILKKFVDNVNPDLTQFINQKIEVSGLIDLFFVKFLDSLTDNDRIEIMKRIREAPAPTLGISNGRTTSKKQIEDRFKKIDNILASIFSSIKKYVSEASKVTKPIYNEYVNNHGGVINKILSILVQNYSVNSVKDAISQSLIKGNVSDYTLVIKDATNVTIDSDTNYRIFTENKGVFDITSTSEEPEVQEEITTEFDKYVKQ